MVGQWFKRFREQLGTERTKVLTDVGKTMAVASFIGAGTLLRTSFLSSTVLIGVGLVFLTFAVLLSAPPQGRT